MNRDNAIFGAFALGMLGLAIAKNPGLFKFARAVGPTKVGKRALRETTKAYAQPAAGRLLTNNLIPITYKHSPAFMAETLKKYPKLSAWSLVKNKPIWEHPTHGDMIIRNFIQYTNKADVGLGVKFWNHYAKVGQKWDNNKIPKAAIDDFRKILTARSFPFKEMFNVSSAKKFADVYTKTSNKTYKFNVNNPVGKEMHKDALRQVDRGSRMREKLVPNPKTDIIEVKSPPTGTAYGHNVMANFGYNKPKNFYRDVWDVKVNRGPGESGHNTVFRSALDYITDPITIWGPLK